MKTIIETSNLCKSYASEGQQLHVLRNIDLEIYDGQFTVIMGPSVSYRKQGDLCIKRCLFFRPAGRVHSDSGAQRSGKVNHLKHSWWN